ncbi:MAG TPA: DtxR family transcriptional regulator, partial [Ruminococcaceae bacterium]|nr:DtxR family transcriptional regulator [Oscillospiraceae bacterium]
YERHVVLSQFFESIGVSDEAATNDACKIEHVISDETFDAIKKLLRDK